MFRAVADDFGWGLLTSEGALWQRQRRLIQPLFTPRHVAAYVGIMTEEATALAERWPRAGGVVDAHAEMIHLALRVVGRAIFGDDVDEAEDVVRWAFPPATRHAFRRACEQAGMQLSADELAVAFRRFKELADTRKAVTLYDVFEEVAA